MSDRYITVRVKLPDSYADATDEVAFRDFADFCDFHGWPTWEVEQAGDPQQLRDELAKAIDFGLTMGRKWNEARKGNIGGRVPLGLDSDRIGTVNDLIAMLREG